MREDYQTTAELAAATTAYAVALELMNKRYETRWTWVMVVAGVAMVGAATARRFAKPLPPLEGRALAWWCWRQVALHFVAGGTPIIIWQIWQDRRLIIAALNYRHGPQVRRR